MGESQFFHEIPQNISSVSDESMPRWIRCVDAFFLIMITVAGLIGNSMVCIAFFLSNKLRTKTNIFVVNLSLADFFTCTTLPIVAWSLLVETEYGASKVNTPCAITLVMTQCFIGCSVLSLTMIALNRWMLIARRRELYDKIYRYRVIFSAQVTSWVFPLLVTVAPLLLGIGSIGYDHKSRNCALMPDHPYSYTYKVVLLTCLMPGPMSLILYCYWSVFKYVKSHNMKIQQSQSEASRTITETIGSSR